MWLIAPTLGYPMAFPRYLIFFAQSFDLQRTKVERLSAIKKEKYNIYGVFAFINGMLQIAINLKSNQLFALRMYCILSNGSFVVAPMNLCFFEPLRCDWNGILIRAKTNRVIASTRFRPLKRSWLSVYWQLTWKQTNFAREHATQFNVFSLQ